MSTEPVDRDMQALLREVLDREVGPHPVWIASPAAQRVGRLRRRGRLARPPLRALAVAAVLVLGAGATAIVGSWRSPEVDVRTVRLPVVVPPPASPRPSQSEAPTPTGSQATPSPSLSGPLGGGVILAHDLPGPFDHSLHDVVALDAGTGVRTQLGTLPGKDVFGYVFQLNADRDHALILTAYYNAGVVSNLQAPTEASVPYGFITRRDIDYGSGPVLSPRGDLIAGTDDIEHPTAIVISGVEAGSQRIPLPTGVGAVQRAPWVLGWSPDQSAVLAIGCRPCNLAETPQERQTADHEHVYIVPLDGSPWRELLDEDNGSFLASWSPDGSTLAVTDFACPPKTNMPKCAFGASTMTLVAVADGSERSLTTTTERTEMAAWSPDGRHIAVVGGKPGEVLKDGGIYVLNADGSGALKVADTNVADVPSVWSPDGRWLAFRKDYSTTEWWIVPAAGGEPRLIGTYGGVAW
jgi:hypothetical protein